MKLKVNSAVFKKQNGESRTMNFVRIPDFTDEFKTALEWKENKETKKRNIQEGMETVFDLDAKQFRIFNWNTIVGEAINETREVSLKGE